MSCERVRAWKIDQNSCYHYDHTYFNERIMASFFSFSQATWQLFPCVLKAGHCHGGASTAKLDNSGALQDAVGLLCAAGSSEFGQYCSLEPYVDAKFDIHIQKIGSSYKAFM
jgi:Synapsin, ATP binding domain